MVALHRVGFAVVWTICTACSRRFRASPAASVLNGCCYYSDQYRYQQNAVCKLQYLLRHLHTLAALISGIVGSGRVSLPQIASHLPDGKQRESCIKRFERFLKNERICQESFLCPLRAHCLPAYLLARSCW